MTGRPEFSARRRRPTKTQRLLDLLAFLVVRRRPVGFDRIQEEVPGYVPDDPADPRERERVRRAFERDKAELRELGLPLENVGAGPREGGDGEYLLRARDFRLPVLRLLEGAVDVPEVPVGELGVRPDELRGAVEALLHVRELPGFPLRPEAHAALAKLTFDLAPDALGLARGIQYLTPFDPLEVEPVLAGCSDALRRRKTLRFAYYAIGPDRESRRRVHALGLLFQGSRWYLVAHDLDRAEPRVFRVDRMRDVEVESARPGVPDYERPVGEPLRPFRERAAWELGSPAVERSVSVRFHPPLHLLARRNGWGEAVEETPARGAGGDGPDGDGSPVEAAPGELRRFRIRSEGPFLRWLLTHWGRIEVVDPPELQARLSALRERTLEAHV